MRFLKTIYEKIYNFYDFCLALYCAHREERLKKKLIKQFLLPNKIEYEQNKNNR